MNTYDLLRIARWVVERTRKNILYSSNLSDQTDKALPFYISLILVRYKGNTPELRRLLKEVSSWKFDLSKNEAHSQNQFWLKSLQSYLSLEELDLLFEKLPTHVSHRDSAMLAAEKNAINACKHRIGNCLENADFAFILMQEYPAQGIDGLPPLNPNEKIPLEKVEFAQKWDHVFDVLNRDTNTSINDVMNWNDDTIIVDPWTKEVYTKKQLFQKSPEIKQFLIDVFSTARIVRKGFLGEMHNQPLHSQTWHDAHQKQPSKIPEKLIDLKEKPKPVENLPQQIKRTTLVYQFSHQYKQFEHAQNEFSNYVGEENIDFAQLKKLFNIYLKKKQKLESICTKLLASGEWNQARALLLNRYKPIVTDKIILSTQPYFDEAWWESFFIKADNYFLLLKDYHYLWKKVEWECNISSIDLDNLSINIENFKNSAFALQSYSRDLTAMQAKVDINLSSPIFAFPLPTTQRQKELQELIHLSNKYNHLKSDFLSLNANYAEMYAAFTDFNKLIYSYNHLDELTNAYHDLTLLHAAFLQKQIARNVFEFEAFELQQEVSALTVVKLTYPPLSTLLTNDIDEQAILTLLQEKKLLIEQINNFEKWFELISYWPRVKQVLFTLNDPQIWFANYQHLFNLDTFKQFQAFFNIALLYKLDLNKIYANFFKRYGIDLFQYTQNYNDCCALFFLQWQPNDDSADLDLDLEQADHASIVDLIKTHLNCLTSFSKFPFWQSVDSNRRTHIALIAECLFYVERITSKVGLLNVVNTFLEKSAALELRNNVFFQSKNPPSFCDTLKTVKELINADSRPVKKAKSNHS